jgi:hypothetical protein
MSCHAYVCCLLCFVFVGVVKVELEALHKCGLALVRPSLCLCLSMAIYVVMYIIDIHMALLSLILIRLCHRFCIAIGCMYPTREFYMPPL